jgi:oligopeptide transport system substrate-binding protein
VLAAACGGDDDDEEPSETDTPSATETEPSGTTDNRRQGGELTVHGQDFESFDPHFSSFAQDIGLFRMVWRGLLTMDKDNKPYPSMAAELPEVTNDGKTYTFTLRDGLQWSDGQPLTAEDFEYGIKRTCNPVNAGNYQFVLVNIVGCDAHYTNTVNDEPTFDQALEDAIGVNAVDDTTLEINLLNPQPTFPILMSLWMTFPAPKHKFPTGTTSEAWPTDPTQLVFNGPYAITEYVDADHLTLVPNENWAAPNGIRPTLDQITVRLIDDSAVAVDAYRTGELDFSDVDTSQLRTIVDEFGEGEEYFKFLLPSTRGLEMNMEDPALSNLDLRLALAMAINREEMVEVVTQGANEPTTSWIPQVTSGVEIGTYDDVIGYNPDKAKEHLEAARAALGEIPTLGILVGDSATARATAEYLKQTIETTLGISTTIEVVDSSTRSSRFTNEQFQLFPGGWIEDYPDMENWIDGQFNTEGSLNHFNCSNAELDAKIEAARFNTNEEERLQQWKDAERLIIENVCGIAPYWHENNHYLIKPNVVGMRENIAGQDAFQPGDWIAEAWGLAEE